jgi:hypothetical protein
MEKSNTYGTVKLSKVKAAIESLEKQFADKPQILDNLEVTFEYLVGSFFPEIVTNINNEMNRQYTAGYLQRLNEEREETKNEN